MATKKETAKPAPTLPRSIVEAAPTSAKIAKELMQAQAGLSLLRTDLMKALDKDHTQLARGFVTLHRLKARIEELTKEFNSLFEEFSGDRVPEALDAAGVRNVPLTEGYRVGFSSSLYASIKGDKRPEAYQWLREHDLGDLIVPTVNAQTLSSSAREMLEEKNVELPPDFFSTHHKRVTSVTLIK